MRLVMFVFLVSIFSFSTDGHIPYPQTVSEDLIIKAIRASSKFMNPFQKKREPTPVNNVYNRINQIQQYIGTISSKYLKRTNEIKQKIAESNRYEIQESQEFYYVYFRIKNINNFLIDINPSGNSIQIIGLEKIISNSNTASKNIQIKKEDRRSFIETIVLNEDADAKEYLTNYLDDLLIISVPRISSENVEIDL